MEPLGVRLGSSAAAACGRVPAAPRARRRRVRADAVPELRHADLHARAAARQLRDRTCGAGTRLRPPDGAPGLGAYLPALGPARHHHIRHAEPGGPDRVSSGPRAPFHVPDHGDSSAGGGAPHGPGPGAACGGGGAEPPGQAPGGSRGRWGRGGQGLVRPLALPPSQLEPLKQLQLSCLLFAADSVTVKTTQMGQL